MARRTDPRPAHDITNEVGVREQLLCRFCRYAGRRAAPGRIRACPVSCLHAERLHALSGPDKLLDLRNTRPSSMGKACIRYNEP
jgi:hypothetical protein